MESLMLTWDLLSNLAVVLLSNPALVVLLLLQPSFSSL
jgi:hypothetical protein